MKQVLSGKTLAARGAFPTVGDLSRSFTKRRSLEIAYLPPHRQTFPGWGGVIHSRDAPSRLIRIASPAPGFLRGESAAEAGRYSCGNRHNGARCGH